MKHLFIVNPVAGGLDKTAEIRAAAEAALKNFPEDELEFYVTKGPHDATEEIRRRAETGEVFRAYACGGDGTFNECVNGAGCHENVAVAPYPSGTGNDFCRMFGSEADLYKDLNALFAGEVHPIDLIDVNGMLCDDIASVGIDARIGTNVHKYTGIPFVKGMVAYGMSAVVEIFKGINRKMHIRCGDFEIDEEVALCCVCNGRYYGGGFQPSLDAMPDDGVLDIFVARNVNLLALAKVIGKYSTGRGDTVPEHITHLKATEISIEMETEENANVDGEALPAKSITMKLLPGALNLIVPKGMTFFS